jgi:hypothetical protein
MDAKGNMKTYYFCHRYGGRPENLARALERLIKLGLRWALEYPERKLVAPWMGLSNSLLLVAAMAPCRQWVREADGIVLDFDGEALSPGMQQEYDEAVSAGKLIVSVDGDAMDEIVVAFNPSVP